MARKKLKQKKLKFFANISTALTEIKTFSRKDQSVEYLCAYVCLCFFFVLEEI